MNESLIYKGNVSIEAGREALNYFINLSKPPDAIFAVEDFTALGVIKAAKENNIDIPGKLGIIGFANEPFGEHITPSLSTIDQQTKQMGRDAFTLLLDLINDNKKQQKNLNIVLEPISIFRESTLKKQKKQKAKAEVNHTNF